MTSPEGDRKNIRIRENQRRSRARKKLQLETLEQRVRDYELTGVGASAEVQHAARRVAEENTLLRGLLHRHGFTDESITEYLRSSSALQIQFDPVTQMPMGNPSESIQLLHRVLIPRRLNPPDAQPSPLLVQGQVSREASTASGSTTSSSFWEPPHPTQPVQNFSPSMPPVPSSISAPATLRLPISPPVPPPHYPLAPFPVSQIPRTETYYTSIPPAPVAMDLRRPVFSETSPSNDGSTAMTYQIQPTFSPGHTNDGSNSGYPPVSQGHSQS